jgi:HSP20 family protein
MNRLKDKTTQTQQTTKNTTMKTQPCSTSSCAPATLDSWLASPFTGFASLAPLFDLGRANDTASGRVESRVWEVEGSYVAEFEVPGVKKEDVKLEVQDRSLSLTATRKDRLPGSDRTFTLTRRLTLPRTVAVDKIAAQLEDGILTVTLPKVEDAQPRAITVN